MRDLLRIIFCLLLVVLLRKRQSPQLFGILLVVSPDGQEAGDVFFCLLPYESLHILDVVSVGGNAVPCLGKNIPGQVFCDIALGGFFVAVSEDIVCARVVRTYEIVSDICFTHNVKNY
jgi:hypothetical protein